MLHHLSKSRYITGLQCPKILWLGINEPDEAAETDPETQRRFDVGHKVGEYAQKLFPGGVLIAEDHTELKKAVEKTKKAADDGASAIFEATVAYNRILCRADILKRVKRDGDLWDLYEVKSTTQVKDQHIPDLAVQKYCFEGLGYKIRKTFLTYVNNKYVRNGDIAPDKLFVSEDVSEDVIEAQKSVPEKAKELLDVMNSPECPPIKPGHQCTTPYMCAYYEFCNEVRPDYSIYELSRGRNVFSDLEALGVTMLKDIPDDFILNKRHRNQVVSVKAKKPVVDKAGIKEHLDMLEYPLYYFDFETISCAIPLFNNARPYQNIPFQYSLHIQKKSGGKCVHKEFLLKGRKDPREELIKAMLTSLGSKGSIVAYNKSFEESCVKGLAYNFPKYKKKLLALLPRFWDLMVPFRSGDYAHYDFHGSASLKYVLPALVPSLSYQDLEIQEGGTASLTAELWFDNKMEKREWKKKYPELLKYCKLDTLAMVEVLKVLCDAVYV